MAYELDIDRRARALSLAGACTVAAMALAVAMGIGRFAFTPLLPLMIRDGSLPQAAGAWLAATNYVGYLLGALTASRLGLSLPTLMRLSLLGTVLSTAAMGAVDGWAAAIILRCIAGVLSAWTLVATSAWALQHLARAGRSDLAGLVFAGVGLGIAFAGLLCLVTGQAGMPTHEIWLGLGVAATLAIVAPCAVVSRPLATIAVREAAAPAAQAPGRYMGLVICYGILGFGYILPATFLPALAREVVDDPRLFGLAWLVFGMAAALSTIAAARLFHHAARLRVWAIGHVLMAIGVVLPSLSLSPAAIAIAALLVGSTFMVVTMVGMQEARERAGANPARLLGLMTASFAIGQLAGPIASGLIDLLPLGHGAALGLALQLAAAALALSAAYLWRHADRGRSARQAR